MTRAPADLFLDWSEKDYDVDSELGLGVRTGDTMTPEVTLGREWQMKEHLYCTIIEYFNKGKVSI